jgi:hypothetical protein
LMTAGSNNPVLTVCVNYAQHRNGNQTRNLVIC